ncbi:MAG: helix-turn-helix domain-containing protein [Oscillospiraceae bacterium]|jgi:transcriptional regulator with XRE-family HTH domain|nr:helix-turn-helix domain-containing protein [Oscillospiraceae bacterium]
MNIGNNLRRYRRERDITQEDLAKVLGISFQAVSKWERGEGYPDITLLPAIAAYFKVSVDELLGMDEARKNEKIQEYIREAWSKRGSGSPEELDAASDVYREAVREFPNEIALMTELANSLSGYRGDEQLTPGCLVEALAVEERIMELSPNTDTQTAIAAIYFRMGQRERCITELDKLPSMLRLSALTRFTRGEEQLKWIQEFIRENLWEVFQCTRFAAPLDTYVFETDSDVFGYTNEERIRILQIGIDAIELTREAGDYTVYAHRISYQYRSMADLSLMDGKTEQALDYLEKSADYAIAGDELSANENASYTSLLMTKTQIQNDGGYTAPNLYVRLMFTPGDGEVDDAYLRERKLLRTIAYEPRYKALTERLKPYYEKVAI